MGSGRRITWVYGEAPEEAFFSPTMGGCQPLPGGNLLVTDSQAGRAFEVARDKRIVWEFFDFQRSQGGPAAAEAPILSPPPGYEAVDQYAPSGANPAGQ